MAADGSNVGTIATTTFFPIAVSWNRAGTMLAYEDNGAIYRVNADGTGKTLLLSAADCGPYGCWRMAWSPSSTADEVAVISDLLPRVLLVPGGGGPATLFYDGDPGWGFDDVAWNPDGSQLAVSATRDQGGTREDHLIIVQRSGGAAVELSFLGMSSIDWSRQDGNAIAMDVVDVAGDGFSRDIYFYDLTTRTLAFVRALARDPSFSPDNSFFAYTSMDGSSGIYKHSMSTGAATRLARNGRAADWKR